jgi:MoxR-like ATPase
MTLDDLFRQVEICRAIENHLNATFLERTDVIRMAFLALLSQEHVYQIGPPGTGKSLLVRTMVEQISGASYFETLLHGEVSLSALSSAPGFREAQVVFLDEVFRAPKNTLLGLLPVLNERIIYSPAGKHLPLLTLFAASNQNPSPADALDAFYDRFTYRSLVRPIRSGENFLKLLLASHEPPGTGIRALNILELTGCRRSIETNVHLDPSAREGFLFLRDRLNREGIVISDRRWKKVLLAARTIAAYSFSESVNSRHLRGLSCVLWSYPPEIRNIDRILGEIA